DHVFIDDAGLKWQRVFLSPNAGIDANIDMDSSKQFTNKTKGWTTGDMWDYSKELGEKRKDRRGHDHINEKYEKERSEKIGKTRERRAQKAQRKKA
ncbi:hypothetical protein CL634_05650, partial [bacterium]|nr:hypothetical protein [bacterium]